MAQDKEIKAVKAALAAKGITAKVTRGYGEEEDHLFIYIPGSWERNPEKRSATFERALEIAQRVTGRAGWLEGRSLV